VPQRHHHGVGHGRRDPSAGPGPPPRRTRNRETYVPPTVGVATVSGRFPGFPVRTRGPFRRDGPSGGPPFGGPSRVAPWSKGRAWFRCVAANARRPNLRGSAPLAGGAVVTGRWGLSGSLADRPVTAHTALGPRVRGAGAVHPGDDLGSAPDTEVPRGATICGQPVGHRPPGPTESGSPSGAGPPLPRHSSGSSALKPVSSAAWRKAGEAPLTRNATPASVRA
jgi:hypothetical protein